MKIILLLALAVGLHAQQKELATGLDVSSGINADITTPPKPSIGPSDLALAHARIQWLEQRLMAAERKAQACFDLYNADMTLNALQKQEPPRPKAKE